MRRCWRRCSISRCRNARAKIAAEELRRRQLAARRRLAYGRRARATDRARLRGSALGRPDYARPDEDARRARRAGALAHRRDRAARIPRAMDDALPPRRRSRWRRSIAREIREHGRRDRRAPRAFEGNRSRASADRTGGVPLFVEEVTRLMLERGERAARRRSRRRCSSRSPRGSTGWARRAKSRRSARCWDANFPTLLIVAAVAGLAPRSRRSVARARKAHGGRPAVCRGRARRRRPIASSMR